MYSTCIHCNAKLGANEVIEIFPVGRRLAFDAARGRLWVVCPKCHRWNLTPLEERWEAIEECERQFRGTRLRASTDNIGLAKVREGLELVRVGKPQRPEMAAWRYAREFKRRWVTVGLPLTGAAVVFTGAQALNIAELFSPVLVWSVLGAAVGATALTLARGFRARVAQPDGTIATLSAKNISEVLLLPAGPRGWALQYDGPAGPVTSEGAPARHALRAILTAQNFQGARGSRIARAVDQLDQAGSSDTYIERLARAASRAGESKIHWLGPDVTLALEMALHEETERRALDGELDALVQEWELAEEIAAISDGMMLPPAVLARFNDLASRAPR